MNEIRQKLEARDITIELSEGAKNFIAEKGYDPVFGARPLRRIIQKYLEDPIADEILMGAFADGTKIYVKMDTSQKNLVFEEMAKQL